ncbi:class I SAM-dependent methyltransferase [Aquipuribacter hungaricus]|uniref:Class I SAM-dependent methyltransferase n=1 Tax=Aquipuribacter hungaricus TaxID=545624 RepID=A0ABV7WFM2_9MICO
MPISSSEGKDWTRQKLRDLAPESLLDVGAGAGTYARLVAEQRPARLVALEVFEPYVERYGLRELYDEVLVGDARTTELPEADVVVMGDVAEHMTVEEAQDLWRRAGEAARRAVYMSIPIVHYPQGALEHNDHEVHVVDDWDHDKVLAAFPGITDCFRGQVVGVYERRTDA